uniref:GDP-mannose 4,6-dehydratase n=1 Tax=viral metagenome TaxID=1070528 RepID=A0A6C0CUU5_9ZZZZ
MERVAFITGLNGQDGSYLTELLLEKNYYVYGIVRRSSNINTKRIDHLYKHSKFQFYYGDMTDACSLQKRLLEILQKHPNMERLEVYNLAAQSHVKVSFEIPEYTCQVNAIGTLNLLEALRALPISLDKIRFYQACTSEMYGYVKGTEAMNEETPFQPVSPYGISKHMAYQFVKTYRDGYGMFACNGILFNHESSRRGETFVTRKVVIGVQNIVNGNQECIELGNLNAIRDWGHAKDYVYGMWLMLQADKPEDYVLGMGETHTVREFVEQVFLHNGYNIQWIGTGDTEVGIDQNQVVRVCINPRYYRPLEVPYLKADSSKAFKKLGWEPSYSFIGLVKEMIVEEKRTCK